ncbi:P-loop containing nucleoside triphosphate hydrolase protein [Stachybotrys elegans]|uniref:P-loop containing nucleoside triphosphate hydrolase protein n=1 Tax=Stachybotrys elegans TaxID=80388 RepID=A0A8K0SJ06_9HYPO|nr:P-loop containing nucleoside triphosphate hydrolase protein [Stachybotrys elegans]
MDADNAITRQFNHAVLKESMPLYRLHPGLLKKYGQHNKFQAEFSQFGARSILKLITIKRGWLTPLTLPDGRVTWAGEDVPKMFVHTVEFKADHNTKKAMFNMIDTLINGLYIATPSTEHQTAQGRTKSKGGLLMNANIFRRLSLTSTDINNFTLTSPTVRNAKVLTDADAATTYTPQTIASAAAQIGGSTSMITRQKTEKLMVSGDIEEVNRLTASGSHTILRWRHYLTRESPKYPFPTNRLQQLTLSVYDSPKYAFIVGMVLQKKEEAKKVLIFASHPLTSMIITALLETAGLRILSITSQHSTADREKAVAHFNHPGSGYHALVPSTTISAFGLDFHRDCSTGIIVESSHSLNTEIHCMGRLLRKNQKENVHWYRLYMQDSFDGFVEAKNMEKMAGTMAADAAIDERITGEARYLVAYEMMREYLGQSVNRYSRPRVRWNHMDSELMHNEGLFYTALAKFIVANPAVSEAITTEKAQEIAQC